MSWRYPKFGLRSLLIAFFVIGLLCWQLRREWQDYNLDFVFEQNLARRIERAGGQVSWHKGVRFRRLFLSVDHSAEIYNIELPPYNHSLTWTTAEREEILRDMRRLRHLALLTLNGPEFTDADFVNKPPLPRQLYAIRFERADVTWVGIEAATQGNTHLSTLSISYSPSPLVFSATGLQRLKKLDTVWVSQASLTMDDIRALTSVPSVHSLGISLCDVDSAQFALVRERNFKYLQLIGTKIDGKPISPEVLEDLKARGTQVLQ